ncbi:MAG TPA: hypothetical protein VKB86_01855 [Pyrinomonadaceae bacterium]|nr:hypothetical protein [Pyrinomonadaceae bacterium]
MLKALSDFKLSRAATVKSALDEVRADLAALGERVPDEDKPVLGVMERLVAGLGLLCEWAEHSLSGEPNAGRFLAAAHAQAVVAAEQLNSVRHSVFSKAAGEAVDELKKITTLEQVTTFSSKLASVPVPIIMLEQPTQPARREYGERASPTAAEGPFVIKAVFEIERRPWRTPQLLRANTIYDFSAKVTVPQFPKNCDYLLIDYISTLSPEHYRVTPLRIDKPSVANATEFSVRGRAEFPVAQDFLSDPIDLLLRATFLSSKDDELSIPATIVGYGHLPVKVSDPSQTPLLSKYRSIDARNAEIIEEVSASIPNLDARHLTDFIKLLGAVTNHMGRNLQRPIYKEDMLISEADFQMRILEDLRMQLGEDVQEAPRQGGGPSDIRYRSVTLELKVEDRIKNRGRMINKYVGQPTQYASASGAQLGILCILDQTSKDEPPANPQNNIILVTAPVHGFDDNAPPYPTKIAAVIIDGNLKLPSDYSS